MSIPSLKSASSQALLGFTAVGAATVLAPAIAAPATLMFAGATIATAAFKSPFLARWTSKAAFSSTLLGLGTMSVLQNLSSMDLSTAGIMKGALFLFGTVVNGVVGYSFYQGTKSKKAISSTASQLAAVDQAKSLTNNLKKQTHLTSETSQAIKELSDSLDKSLTHLRDIRDKKPSSIASGKISSQRAAGEEPIPATIIQAEVKQAQHNSHTALGIAAKKAEHVKNLLPKNTQIEKIHQLLTLAAPKTLSDRQQIELNAKEQEVLKNSLEQSWKNHIDDLETHAFEAHRIRNLSTINWISKARGRVSWTLNKKNITSFFSHAVRTILLKGSLPMAATAGAVGALEYMQGSGSVLATTAGMLGGLLGAATVHCGEARQGSKAWNVCVATHEELVPLQTVAPRQQDPEEKVKVLRNLDDRKMIAQKGKEAVPELAPNEKLEYVEEKMPAKVQKMESQLDGLEKMAAQIKQGILKSFFAPPQKQKLEPVAKAPRPPVNEAIFRDKSDPQKLRSAIKSLALEDLDELLRKQIVTHEEILDLIITHPAAQDGAAFTLPFEGKFLADLRRQVRQADRDVQSGNTPKRFVFVKDLFGPEATAGSKTMHVTDLPESPYLKKMEEKYIVVRHVSMTAGANGGTGTQNNEGAVGHPRRKNFDTAGSSSGCAYLGGLDDFPGHLFVGSDTGGSITAPVGVMNPIDPNDDFKMYGWVPEKNHFSMEGMVPYDVRLDTPGIIGTDQEGVMQLVYNLTEDWAKEEHKITENRPTFFYFESDLEKGTNSPERIQAFKSSLEAMKKKGQPVVALGAEFDGLRDIPCDSYHLSYVMALYTAMNPTQKNKQGEAPRYILDENLMKRFAHAIALLESPDLVDRLINIYVRLFKVYHELFNQPHVIGAPMPDAVPLDALKPDGNGPELLDIHDYWGGMLKNNTGNAAFVNPKLSMVMEGGTKDILYVTQAAEAKKVPVEKSIPIQLDDDYATYLKTSYFLQNGKSIGSDLKNITDENIDLIIPLLKENSFINNSVIAKIAKHPRFQKFLSTNP